MVSAILIALAAIFNAFMDRIDDENFWDSIFKKWNQRFWYKRVSWEHAKVVFRYKLDAWHLAKSATLFCLCFAIVFFESPFLWWINFSIAGIIWILVFNLFYNVLFKSKRK